MTVQDSSSLDERVSALLFGGLQDPFPIYDELRETGDGVVFASALGLYLVTRYDDVLAVGRDHTLFSSDTFGVAPAGVHDPNDPEHVRFADISSRDLMFKDPPEHTRLRAAVRAAFVPRAVEQWRPLVEAAVAELLDRFDDGQEIELMREFAAEVPVAVITAILGIPGGDRVQFREWSFGLASTFDPGVHGEDRDRAIRASLELFDYLAEFAEERRRTPGDDLTSAVIAAAGGDDPLDAKDILAQLSLLLAAGNETTSNLLGNGLTALLARPEALRRLVAEPALLPQAIEEMLRFDPPLHLDARKAAADTRLGDTDIPAQAPVAQVLAAANRDPRRFADPESFDIERDRNHHLAFNHGIHFCVGAPLARLEGEVIFRRLLERFPNVAEGSEPAVRRTVNVVSRGWETRPVTLNR